LDIKNLHKPFKIGRKDRLNLIFDEMAKSAEIESYNLPAVKALIEVRWDAVWWKMVVFVLVPYAILLALFSYYTINDLISEVTAKELGLETSMNICSYAILGIIAYFLVIEILQMIRGSAKIYLSNIWNLIQFLLMILIAATEITLLRSRELDSFGPNSTVKQQ